MRVLDNLDTFEGRSQFTTWAHKIAVRAALTELRHRHWREVPLPEMQMHEKSDTMEHELPDGQASPEEQEDSSDMLQRVNRILMEELTAKQRQALMAVGIQGYPLEEGRPASGDESQRPVQADARRPRGLKKRLEEDGLTHARSWRSLKAPGSKRMDMGCYLCVEGIFDKSLNRFPTAFPPGLGAISGCPRSYAGLSIRNDG